MGAQRARGVGGAERPGEAALQGLLTCRLHISEMQSSLISPRWVSEALPLLRVFVLLHVCLHFFRNASARARASLVCKCVCSCAGNGSEREALM